jgi:RNA polymerase sigma factor (TIGR02999 family)
VTDTNTILTAAAQGDRAAAQQLMPRVYDELRRLAGSYLAGETVSHTLQPTALVNEAYIKLVDQTRVDWKGRTHFFAVAAQAMRRILVDHARRRNRQKRGGGRRRVEWSDQLQLSAERDDDLLALDDALNKLAELDSRQAQIVELRFFGGLTVAEVSQLLGLSKRTVEAEWTMIKAWLRRELSGEEST